MTRRKKGGGRWKSYLDLAGASAVKLTAADRTLACGFLLADDAQRLFKRDGQMRKEC